LGWAKEEVYETKPRTSSELEEQIRDIFASVSLDLSRKSFEFVSSGMHRTVV
jgi:hypothetical protein